MKWQKPGHEYDETYRQMNMKTAFYLYGAGDGQQGCGGDLGAAVGGYFADFGY